MKKKDKEEKVGSEETSNIHGEERAEWPLVTNFGPNLYCRDEEIFANGRKYFEKVLESLSRDSLETRSRRKRERDQRARE